MIIFFIAVGVGTILNLIWVYACHGNIPMWLSGVIVVVTMFLFGWLSKILTLKEIDAYESSR